MAYQYTRIALIVASFVAGIVLLWEKEYVFGGVLIAGGILISYSYYKHGNIWLIFRKIKNRDYEGADKLLQKIQHPEKLPEAQRGYYFFSCGYLSLHHKDLDQAKDYFELALEHGLRFKNDRAIAYINLAHISRAQNKVSAAKGYLKKARKYQPAKAIVEDIEKMEKQIHG